MDLTNIFSFNKRRYSVRQFVKHRKMNKMRFLLETLVVCWEESDMQMRRFYQERENNRLCY